MATKLYLNLYDGHYDPDMGMDDYGFAGPSIGPLRSVGGEKKGKRLSVVFSDFADAAKFGIDVATQIIPCHENGLLRIQIPGEKEVFYGQWSLSLGED